MTTKRKEKNQKEKSDEENLPKWITDHFTDSLNSLELLMQITSISAKGIAVLRGMPKVLNVLAKVQGIAQSPSSILQRDRVQKDADLAMAEVEKDFPVLHGLAVVALWSWMEHFVKDFIALWLRHRRDALNAIPVQKLKVKLGDYLMLSKIEQAKFLVELLEHELASSQKGGVTRFEALLQPFGLSFSLQPSHSKAIFELQQIRNVVAHRNSRVDRRLRTECPWLNLKINQQVLVSSQMLKIYADACGEFLLAFLYRVGDVYGLDLRKSDTDKNNSEVE